MMCQIDRRCKGRGKKSAFQWVVDSFDHTSDEESSQTVIVFNSGARVLSDVGFGSDDQDQGQGFRHARRGRRVSTVDNILGLR